MKKFEKVELNSKDYRTMEILADITRIILTPVFLLVRIYCWVWDYNYYDRFKH